jgi:tetratricopeptide (TPR) repeat protein
MRSREELDHEIQQELKEQMSRTPSEAQAYVSIGYRAMIDLEEEKAILAFERAAQVQRDLASPHQFLGLIHADRGEDERAIEYFRHCIELECEGLDPAIEEENPYYHMGWCLENLNQLEAAERILRQGTKQVSSHYRTYLRLGRLYHRQAKYEAAVAVYEAALEAISTHTRKPVGDDLLGVIEGAEIIGKLVKEEEKSLVRMFELNLLRARSGQSYQALSGHDL